MEIRGNGKDVEVKDTRAFAFERAGIKARQRRFCPYELPGPGSSSFVAGRQLGLLALVYRP